MSEQNITLPDVGEGLTEAEIVTWHVAAGDRVELNQVIVEIETAKSLVELPSPLEGVIGSVLFEEGQTVEVGSAILTVRTDAADGPAAAAPTAAPSASGVQTAATPDPATPTSSVSDEAASATADTAATIAPSNEGG